MPDMPIPDDATLREPPQTPPSSPALGPGAGGPLAPGAASAVNPQPSLDAATQRWDMLRKEAAEKQGAYDAMMNKGMADYQGAVGDMRQAIQNRPQQQPIPQSPKSTMGDDAGAWLTAATLIGAISGGFSRKANVNALTAFTGTLQGAQEGNKAKFEEQEKAWEAAVKEVEKTNQQRLDAYKATLEDKKLSMDEKLQVMQLKARQFQDDQMFQAAAAKDPILVAQLHDHGLAIQEQYRESMVKLRADEKEKALRSGAGRQLSDEAIQQKVDQIKAGIPAAQIMRGLGRADIAEINNRFAAGGGNAGDVVNAQQNYTRGQAAARVGGGMEERIGVATNEMKAAIPLALDASNRLPRGQFVPINELRQMGQAAMSNPAYNDFLVKNNALVKAYGRAMNPQGVPRVTENAEARADGILSKAISPEAYETQARALWQEATNVQRAVQASRPGAAPLPSPFEGGTTAPSQPTPSGTTQSGLKWSIQ